VFSGQDFILQIDPLGCTNSPVRSDLLEEQEVAVFCPVYATQLNPMIDVEDIDRITLTLQDRPAEVLTVGYYPARAALGTGRRAELTTPVLGNIGYAVIVLKRQPNETAMPDFVEGNLSARMIYDIENAFGTGRNMFYLPELTEEEWNREYRAYSFWDGRGYLRLEGADNEGATIGVYSDRDISGRGRTEKTRVSLVNLKEGETSPNEIYIPGFDYCLGRVKVKLHDVENADTSARIRIDSDVIEVKEGEKFLENRCTLKDIEKAGLVQKVEINCREDEGRENFLLTLSPKLNLSINGEFREVGIGDFLYKNGNDYVFLGFIGSNSSISEAKENLYVRLKSIPGDKVVNKQRLTESEISFMASYDKALSKSDVDRGIILDFAKILLRLGAHSRSGLSRFFSGEKPALLKYGEGEEIFGTKIQIIGYYGAQNIELSNLPENLQEYYENAIDDYETVIQSFAEEKYPAYSPETLGEQALREEIRLLWKIGQRNQIVELCEFYETNYGNLIDPECTSAYLLANTQIDSQGVVVNGQTHSISFEKIKEPSFKEFGAKILVDGVPYELSKDEILYLNEETNEFVQLIDLEENSANLRINLDREDKTAVTVISDALLRDTRVKLDKREVKTFDSRYSFSLSEVNLERSVKVSLEPEIDYARANASFNFKIGIDKRDFQLSPEKTQERLNSLNNTVEKFRKISDTLGNVVKIGKTACLATGAALTIKNFFANLGGKGIARSTVMRADGVGWYDRCQVSVNADNSPYKDVEACLLDNSKAIGDSVKEYEKALEEQEEITSEDIDENYRSGISSDLQGVIAGITVAGNEIGLNEIIPYLNEDTIGLSDARDLQLNANLLDSKDDSVRAIAEANVEEILGEVYSNSRAEQERQTLENKYGLPTVIGSGRELTEFTITQPAKTLGQSTRQFTGADIESSTLVYLYKDRADGQEYLFVLDNDYVITKTYKIGGGDVLSIYETESNSVNPLGIALTRYDPTTYENPYENPEIRYYETDPYKGVPAVVPFDLQKGWYAAVKSTLPFLGGLQAYDQSGRVMSFYVCNVGENKREDFIGGDDICRGFVSGTGQSPDFPGLDERDSEQLKEEARKAIEQASRAYRSGVKEVTINRRSIPVGEPAFDLPDIQCEDFMSPADCNILFNACDPFICPSSRCDLGGAYPVKDVVQSGIFGSIALCYPNAKWEGGSIYVPVCVSGVHAGVEGWTSILESYSQCLQTSLDTGETVGICDELNSVYMCEFAWRQGLPIAKYYIPQVLGKVLGQGSGGGGEYLAVQDAWENAEQSIDYFTQYYAANSYEAFKARSAESVGTELCKQYISWTSPDGGNLLDALTEPDSPPQFYGRFDELPEQTITNPPSSHYKVFYHIYAGTDFPAYYQVYLRGTSSSFYQDTGARRIVAGGFIKRGEYATNTEDFTAPSGYQELCIVVNGQEECGFKQVTTMFGLNYLTESYIAGQADNTNIDSEAECISGSPDVFSLLNPVTVGQTLSGGASISSTEPVLSELANPAIYNRGIIRICSTENPGLGTDAAVGTEGARWQEVGTCGDNTNLKCWLDRESVKDTIRNSNIEDDVLEEVASQYQTRLEEEGDYLSEEGFEALYEEIEELQKKDATLDIIELITSKIEKTFYNYQRGYLHLSRGAAYGVLTLIEDNVYKDQLKISGETTEKETEKETEEEESFEDKVEREKSRILEEGIISSVTGLCSDCGKGAFNICDEIECLAIGDVIRRTCVFEDRLVVNACIDEGPISSEEEEIPETCSASTPEGTNNCRKLLGNRIIEIAQEEKQKANIENIDETVRNDIGAKNFECFILQVAKIETILRHCTPMEMGGDPFYCNENLEQVYGSPEGENSKGIMQINTDVHPEVDVADFETNVEYGISLLIDNYKNPPPHGDPPTEPPVYNCYKTDDGDFIKVTYDGWQRSVREYNGWNSACVDEDGKDIGNPHYVKNITSAKTKNYIKNLFPETCA
jgi:hypothetical protein